MPTIELDLDGYTDLPPGHIANVVTYFEMRSPDEAGGYPLPADFSVRRIERPDVEAYRALYRRIGHEWLWVSRIAMPEAELAAILRRPTTELLFLMRGEEAVGLCEIHRLGTDVEIKMFGIVPEVQGTGAAKGFLSAALDAAWQAPTERVWLHTCSFDHPAAVHFYRRMGFTPFKFAIEVTPDPRLEGVLPETAGPHVALIRPKAE
ncbi:GNAT family N-acetyltransferase [Kaistia algarum]|uniref:GNAT family N-acetyltransferase n=1 Tax=Kaistia algarum TaxID=2083279 RepID=UPI000CE902EC|nr:GNAT family N-acetyltransferase [Kaistia algarum]MCX5516266.1 GNAT family N-acetyltransferase [Kaistia algarum]PPE78810.1 GNAT family N-acetyltransferase [Kaistia algarum]